MPSAKGANVEMLSKWVIELDETPQLKFSIICQKALCVVKEKGFTVVIMILQFYCGSWKFVESFTHF
jgi:hypothetical protein